MAWHDLTTCRHGMTLRDIHVQCTWIDIPWHVVTRYIHTCCELTWNRKTLGWLDIAWHDGHGTTDYRVIHCSMTRPVSWTLLQPNVMFEILVLLSKLLWFHWWSIIEALCFTNSLRVKSSKSWFVVSTLVRSSSFYCISKALVRWLKSWLSQKGLFSFMFFALLEKRITK